jgi:hypothetical protein
MNYFNVYTARFSAVEGLPHLQRTILGRTRVGTLTGHGYNIEIKAALSDVADAVESAYILTPKDDLPKVTASAETRYGRRFHVEGHPFMQPPGKSTAAEARKRATAWLAIAQHLEVEEKAKAYEEAKAKAVADAMNAAAEAARKARLNELADEWFGKDYNDLGPNKAAAIKEIHRLETQLNAKDAA